MNILATDSENERQTTGGGTDPISIGAITVPETNFAQPEVSLVPLDTSSSQTITHEATISQRANLPWWRRPSPWWLLTTIPISTITKSATLAPQITIYTQLVCEHLASTNLTALDVPLKECAADPQVQATVAKLATVLTTTMGVLSCLTTGWWAQFSDRHGRTRVMGIGLLGFFFYDLVFIAVAKYSVHLPGGYWNLIWGNLVEGCLGGFTAAMAAYHAYIADTTLPGTRSHIFSLAMGLVYIGMAIGPALGSMIIAGTGEILSVFYLTAFVHLCFISYVWILMPESLAQDKMGVTYRRYFEARATSSARGSMRIMKKVVSSLDPLRVLMFPAEHAVPARDRTHEKRNYNLAYIATAYGCSILLMGLMSYQFQYATWTFHWGTEELGFFLSLVSAVRAVHLMIVLPVLVRYMKHRQQKSPIRLNEDSERSSNPPMHDPTVDIMLLRVSLLLEIVAYVGLTVVRHPTGFIAFSVCNALGSGVSPAAQSLALEAFTAQGGHESGRLFGALSVIQALSSQIVGPALFGFVYMATVASIPSAIFGLSALFLTVSFVFSCLVRGAGFRPAVAPLAEQVDHTLTEEEVVS